MYNLLIWDLLFHFHKTDARSMDSQNGTGQKKPREKTLCKRVNEENAHGECT